MIGYVRLCVSVCVSRALFAAEQSFVDAGHSGRLMVCEGVASCTRLPSTGERSLWLCGCSAQWISVLSVPTREAGVLGVRTRSRAGSNVRPVLLRRLGRSETRATRPRLVGSSHYEKCAGV
jgi:hypothetical protein